jgi:predicted metalloprotease with PDZ domain
MAPVRYVLSMPRPSSHLLRVRIEAEASGGDFTDFVLPSWTPGSYKIRDYARNVQDFRAPGRSWRKVDKARWRVEGGGDVVVEYDVWAFELMVQGSHHDDEHAFVSGAGVFAYVDGRKDSPLELEIRTPRGWSVATGLERRGRRWVAPDYDTLADCPIEAGRFEERTFRVRGVPHRLVIHGPGNHDPAKLVADLRKIVETEVALFRHIPYRDYTFILHNTAERGGGLEHRNSTALQYAPSGYRPREKYENFLELAAHEFFHTWNVKRIRPEMLGPFDYTKEVHTTLLWVMEGITSYYDTLLCCRAKLFSDDRYLKKTAERIDRFEEKPGRRRQSLSESSFDAWVKLYQPSENASNCQMSYYEKGELAGLCLDLDLRRRTGGRRSLDDVMRLLYEEWARRGLGFPEPEFRRACERVAGGSLQGFWDEVVDGVGDLDWNARLRPFGLELVLEPKKPEEGEAPRKRRPWLGASLQKSAAGALVASVVEAGPAWKAGISPKDEIVALDGLRVGADDLEKRIDERRPGGRVRLALFRSGALREIPVVLGSKENAVRVLRRRRDSVPAERRLYEGWLGVPFRRPS